ncbi:hypothetical protein ACE939_01755 [Aquimarina sp. W85]|uniref:hypothetical protein n=1 Tax=Aquimarina rhodophyticola TaxID=3342246 RepID=UPI00366D2F91
MDVKIDYSFGSLEFFDNYLIYRMKDVKRFTLKDSKKLLGDITKHYGRKKYVFISQRDYQIDIEKEAYKLVNTKRMLGCAFVSTNKNTLEDAKKEQQWFDNSYGYFSSINEAIAWAETIIKKKL